MKGWNVTSALLYCGLLITLLPMLAVYIFGAVNYLFDLEDNNCEMTYMFEYPQYVRVSLADEIEDRYGRYGLYAYGEGFVTEKLRKMQFSGIPVLFLPGNAGSHEQVRSLASVSLRKSLKDRTPFHFDFFSVSFGKDYSALYGGVLMEETEYVAHCIKKILTLYDGKMRNVVLIGHSMGGIVAKGALTMTDIDATYSSLIINLATPHVPSLVFDRTIVNYYNNLQKVIHKLEEHNTTIVSIGGGSRDTMVTSIQAVDPSAVTNVLATAVPTVWCPADHLSILWCKQLMFAVVRALFHCVDVQQRPIAISSSEDFRNRAVKYHLFQRYAGKTLLPYKEKFDFEKGGEWIEDIRRQYTWTTTNSTFRKEGTTGVYLMIRLIGSPADFLTVEAVNLDVRDWVFGCSAFATEGSSRVCEWGWNLTNKTRLAPDHAYRSRKTLDLNVNELMDLKLTHVIIRIPPNEFNENAEVKVDFHSRDSRTLYLSDKQTFTELLFNLNRFNNIRSSFGEIRYVVNLSGISNVVKLSLRDTNSIGSENMCNAMVELIEPWNPGAGQVRFFSNKKKGPTSFKVQTAYKRVNPVLLLRFTMDPKCSYTFRLQRGNLIERIGISVRDRWSTLYTIAVSQMLLAIANRVDRGVDCGAIPIMVTTILLGIALGFGLETCAVMAGLHLAAVAVCCSIVFFGSFMQNFAVKFFSRIITFSTTWTEWILGGLHQLPFLMTIIILSIVPVTCGALAMFFALFMNYLKLVKMYEDYVEELFFASLRHFNVLTKSQRSQSKENESTRDKIIDELVFFLTWCLAAIPAVPSVLVWAKNFSHKSRLSTEDPVQLCSWIILIGCSTLGLVQIPSTLPEPQFRFLGMVLRCIGWLTFSTLCTQNPAIYQWCMPPLIAAVGVTLLINYVLPSSKSEK